LRRRYLGIRSFYDQVEVSGVREVRARRTPDLLGMTPAEWALNVEAGVEVLNQKQRQVIEMVHFEGQKTVRMEKQIGNLLCTPTPCRSDSALASSSSPGQAHAVSLYELPCSLESLD
jgi:hypothetical protein